MSGTGGLCRTDLHVLNGELPDPQVLIIPCHEIVGRIDALGAAVKELRIGERVSIRRLGHGCVGLIGRAKSASKE